MICRYLVPSLLLSALLADIGNAQVTLQIEFFETHIRPVLADKCYRCHGDDTDELEGGLNVTYRQGLLVGGDRGPALAPGNVEDSVLLKALRYDDDELQMPRPGSYPPR